MGFVVLCDFDGTILNVDTCAYILKKYAKEDWRIFDEQFEKGKISLKECLQKQFSTVVLPETEILNEIRQVASVRPSFARLVEYCGTIKVPVIIVSAGLDFVIKHFLEMEGWSNSIQVYAPKAKCTADGIKLTFPRLVHNTSTNFKDDLVARHKEQGRKVAYVGDGVADYEAARNADVAFAIEDSKLAMLLKKNKIPYTEISEFQRVVEIITSTLWSDRAHSTRVH